MASGNKFHLSKLIGQGHVDADKLASPALVALLAEASALIERTKAPGALFASLQSQMKEENDDQRNHA